jgi:hypothetical protein
MKFVRVSREGTDFIRLCDDEYNYSHGYYAANNWLDDDHILLARTAIKGSDRTRVGYDFSRAEYVLVDLKNETETVVISDYEEHPANTQGYLYGSEFYFFAGRDLVAHDLLTGARRTVLTDERAHFSDVRRQAHQKAGAYYAPA